MPGWPGESNEGMCDEARTGREAELEELFPNLRATGYEITSPRDRSYNCVGWAVLHSTTALWWPVERRQSSLYSQVYDWPRGIARKDDVASFVRALQHPDLGGYEPCDSAVYEPGFERIAVYALRARATHVARQVDTHWWTSKLGQDEDLRHSLEGLTGSVYGEVHLVLRRPSTP